MENIKERIEKVKKEAESLGLKNFKIYQQFDPERLNILWYDGEIASFDYKNYAVIISASGDVDASFYLGDKQLLGFHKEPCLVPELKEYLTDKDLESIVTRFTYVDEKIAKLQNKTLFITANNWLEFNVINKDTNLYWDLLCCNIIEEDSNILEALENLQDYIDFIEENKEEYDK